MMKKQRPRATFLKRVLYSMMASICICSAVAQNEKEATNNPSSVSPEENVVSSNTLTTNQPTDTTGQEAATHAPDATPDALPAANSGTETNDQSNTNGIVPTDPSMIPPPVSTENSTNVPLPMDPSDGSTNETVSEQPSPINSTESIEKKKQEIKVRYNEVRTQVEKEEAVVALRKAADKATTSEGQRQTLKAYYELLFKRMKQVDASLTERCDVMQGAYLRRLEQLGLEPTVPLQLPNQTSSQDVTVPAELKGKVPKKTSTPNATQ